MQRSNIGALVLLLASLALVACAASPGAGKDCDPCATAEINPGAAGSANAAAAAAADGGQRLQQGPTGEDRFRVAPNTAVSRGQGPAIVRDASREKREVANGAGINNLAFGGNSEAEATAQAQNQGTSLEAREAAKTVAFYRTQLQLAAMNPSTTPATLEFLGNQLSAAQADLALASQQIKKNVTYNLPQWRVTYATVTAVKTGNQQGIDPEVVEPLMSNVTEIVENGAAEYEEYPSTDPSADPTDDSLPDPPLEEAPVAEPTPEFPPADGG